MQIIDQQPIPQWLFDEVEEYFIPLSFEPTTILDIGANIGAFTLQAKKRWPNAHAICCEPMAFNLVHLRRNAPQGSTIISAAVREHSGLDEIFVGDNFVTGGFVNFGRQTANKLLVECIAAADLPSCELLKIDTEGSEVEILTHLDLSKTKAIMLEYHSRADAATIQAMLDAQFERVNEDAGTDIGTFIFFRK